MLWQLRSCPYNITASSFIMHNKHCNLRKHPWRFTLCNLKSQLFHASHDLTWHMFFLYQIYDTGSIDGPSGSFTVNNVQVFAGYVLHIGSFTKGSEALSVGDVVKCKVKFCADNFLY
jgi:hypothetical protein